MKYHAMYSYELADAAGVNRKTFRKWLKCEKEELAKLGYNINMRIMPPQVVRYLCEKYVIILDG